MRVASPRSAETRPAARRPAVRPARAACPAGRTFKRRSSVALCETFNELPASRARCLIIVLNCSREGLANKHNFVRNVVSETNACDE